MPSAHDTEAKWRQQGRAALENYHYIRPYDYPTLHHFLDALERRYDILKSFAGDMSDRVRIWYCLNLLEEADPHWENRLHAFKSRRIRKTKHKKKLEKVEWELFLDWDDFVWHMVDRGGEMNFREPVDEEAEKSKPKSSTQPASQTVQQTTGTAVVQQPSVVKPAPVQPVEKQAVETQLRTSSPPPATNTTSEATLAVLNVINGKAAVSVTWDTANDTSVKYVLAKDALAKDKPVRVLNGGSRQVTQNGSNGKEAAYKTSTAATTKLDKPMSKTSTTVNKLGDDEDYVDIPEGGYADDLNYEDVDDATVDNDRDEKDIVHVNGEVRYQIPGYAARKKPRHTLVSAPRFVIKNFFRAKFPGRPRCLDCGCQHPTERYMLCSNCNFCHVGGDQECYHQHPELRGTRPDKDKYRRPASPISSSEPDLDALSDVESDSETIKGANDDTVKVGNSIDTADRGVERAVDGDLANNLKTLTIFEKHVDKIEFVRDQTPEAFVFNSPQATPAAQKTVQPIALQEAVGSIEEATEDVSLITAKLESTSISVPSPTPASTPTAASIPAPIAATPAAAPVRDRQAALSALSAPSPASSNISKADNADEGGAPLNAENLSRVPHDQSHRRWASMSSLTTSSSGESLIAFRRRRTNQVKKKTAAKEASDKAAAEKAAAEKAAAEKAAAEKAAAEKLAAEKLAAEKLVADRLAAEKAAADKTAAEKAAAEKAAAEKTIAVKTATQKVAAARNTESEMEQAKLRTAAALKAAVAAASERVEAEKMVDFWANMDLKQNFIPNNGMGPSHIAITAAKKAHAREIAIEAAKKAEVKEAEAREAVANEKRLEVEEQLRREREEQQANREAERQAHVARDRAEKEARLARQEEQRIANKKAKAARKRERQRDRRREREEQERWEQEQQWGQTRGQSWGNWA